MNWKAVRLKGTKGMGNYCITSLQAPLKWYLHGEPGLDRATRRYEAITQEAAEAHGTRCIESVLSHARRRNRQ
jgi:hypothetical protein